MATPSCCPVCLDAHTQIDSDVAPGAGGWGYRVKCDVCGRFDIVREAWDDHLDPDSPGTCMSALDRARLSHIVKTATSAGPSGLPCLDSDDLDHFKKIQALVRHRQSKLKKQSDSSATMFPAPAIDLNSYQWISMQP